MKKLIFSFCLIGFSSFVFADDWVKADKIKDEYIDNYYSRCYYKTSSYGRFADQHVSFVVEGSTYKCPSRIKLNPLTNEWKKD